MKHYALVLILLTGCAKAQPTETFFSDNGALFLRGTFNGEGVIRNEGQLILQNYPGSGHTIMSLDNVVADEESAIESVGRLSNGAVQQQGAEFWRWVDSDNYAAGFESVYGLHATKYGADYTPLLIWGRGSVLLGGGLTTNQRWHDPIPDNWTEIGNRLMTRNYQVIGNNHAYYASPGFGLEVEGFAQFGTVDGNGFTNNAVQVGYSSGEQAGFIQAYNNSSSFLPLIITATKTSVRGNLILEAPTVPTTSSSACEKGQISYTNSYLYVCIQDNNWRRTALEAW